MTRIKFDIGEEEVYPVLSAIREDDGIYSLTDAEFAAYEAACEEYNLWQDRLNNLKPDDYVPPKPLKRSEDLTYDEIDPRFWPTPA